MGLDESSMCLVQAVVGCYRPSSAPNECHTNNTLQKRFCFAEAAEAVAERLHSEVPEESSANANAVTTAFVAKSIIASTSSSHFHSSNNSHLRGESAKLPETGIFPLVRLFCSPDRMRNCKQNSLDDLERILYHCVGRRATQRG